MSKFAENKQFALGRAIVEVAKSVLKTVGMEEWMYSFKQECPWTRSVLIFWKGVELEIVLAYDEWSYRVVGRHSNVEQEYNLNRKGFTERVTQAFVGELALMDEARGFSSSDTRRSSMLIEGIEAKLKVERFNELKTDMHVLKFEIDAHLGNEAVSRTYYKVEPEKNNDEWFTGYRADGRCDRLHVSGEWQRGGRTVSTHDSICWYPQLISDAEMTEFLALEAEIDDSQDRLSRAFIPWRGTEEKQTEVMAAVEQRRTKVTQEKSYDGSSYEKDPTRWYENDKWDNDHGMPGDLKYVHGLAGKEIYLNGWIKNKQGKWRKVGYVKINHFGGIIGDEAEQEANEELFQGSGYEFVNRLKAYLRDSEWDAARLVDAYGMPKYKGEQYTFAKCFSDVCKPEVDEHAEERKKFKGVLGYYAKQLEAEDDPMKQSDWAGKLKWVKRKLAALPPAPPHKESLHRITETHVKCCAPGCTHKKDRQWLEVFFRGDAFIKEDKVRLVDQDPSFELIMERVGETEAWINEYHITPQVTGKVPLVFGKMERVRSAWNHDNDVAVGYSVMLMNEKVEEYRADKGLCGK